MNAFEVNQALAAGDVHRPEVLPKLALLEDQAVVFRVDFGLEALPEEPGILLIRGPRQYGKSTWLQQRIRATIEAFGPGSAFYLNGDELRDDRALEDGIRTLLPLYGSKARVRRLFVDEVTAVKGWERAFKRLLDSNALRDVLVVTTGSKAADLRRGAERLPGRKGRLARTQYLFTPISYGEFARVCADKFSGDDLLPAYLLAGGSPPACLSLVEGGAIAPYIVEMVRDWVYGEFAASGRSRAMLIGVLECLYRFGGTPSGQSKIAREAGLANNTVAAGYVEMLADLMCVAPTFAWDASRGRVNRRKPCKYHMTNLLAATAWHPQRLRHPSDFHALPSQLQAVLLEWMVAQECWRRAAIRGDETPELMSFWAGESHELDFVLAPDRFLEVKRGKSGPLDFAWFPRTFPGARLTVISASTFETDQIVGCTMEEFLTQT